VWTDQNTKHILQRAPRCVIQLEMHAHMPRNPFPYPEKLKARVPMAHPRRGVRLAEERQAVLSASVLWRDRSHEVTILC